MIQASISFTDLSPGSWETIVWSLVAFLIVVVIANVLASL